MIAAIARAMPTGSNRNTDFSKVTTWGLRKAEKNEHPGSDEISNRQIDATLSPSNALRKGVQGDKDGSQSVHHQPNEAHQYRPLFFDSTMKATMLVSPSDMPAPATLAMAPADKEGRAIRCDATNHTAEIEDHC